MFQQGQVIKIKELKRVRFHIDHIGTDNYSQTLFGSPVYEPAPRSKAKIKNVFSKMQHKILRNKVNIDRSNSNVFMYGNPTKN